MISYEVVVLPEAERDIESLDSSIRKRCFARLNGYRIIQKFLGKSRFKIYLLPLKG